MTRLKALGIATAVAAVALPLGVVIAGAPNVDTEDIARQTTAYTGKQEARRDWKKVPGLDPGFGNVVDSPDLISFTVSAQMTKGAAKFRIVPIAGGPVAPPGVVRFTSKAANSFSWTVEDSCGDGDFRELQWKKAGRGPVVAAKIATHAVWNDFCF